MIGQKFNRLTVIAPTKKRSGGCIVWLCECECGNMVEVNTNNLKSGGVKSCGCIRGGKAREIASRIKKDGFKVCPKCGDKKSLSCFFKNSNRGDGVSYCCKECSRSLNREWYAKTIDDRRKAQRLYYSINREKMQKKRKKYTRSIKGTIQRAKMLLTRNSCLSQDDLPEEIVATKVLQLQLKRELKNGKNGH